MFGGAYLGAIFEVAVGERGQTFVTGYYEDEGRFDERPPFSGRLDLGAWALAGDGPTTLTSDGENWDVFVATLAR